MTIYGWLLKPNTEFWIICVQVFEVFDIETITRKNVLLPYSICWTSGDEICYETLISNEDLAHLVLNRFKPNVVYYAHNLIFDLSFMLPTFLKFQNTGLIKKVSWFCVDFDLYWVKLTLINKNQIILKCSFKLIPWSLRNFFPKLCSLPKIQFPYEILSNWNPRKEISIRDGTLCFVGRAEECLRLYALRDCYILKEALTKVWQLAHKLSPSIKPHQTHSIGGLSLNIFKFFNKKRERPLSLKLPAEQISVYKQAYRGGRCEIFGNPRQGEKILHFDFPGMYHSCLYGKFPLNKLNFCENPTDTLKPGFYSIELEYENNIPVLPVKLDKLLFPQGKVSGIFWYEEIILALETSYVKKFIIHNAWLVEDYDYCLKDYAEALADIRNQAEYKSMAKRLANSLYGRLGMSSDLLLTNLPKLENNVVELRGEYAEYANLVLLNQRITQATQSNVAVAAIITSRARIKLYRAFLDIQNESGRLLYCDTDSIVAAFPTNAAVENKKIGEVFFDTSKEDTQIDAAVFIAPKTYGLITQAKQEIIKLKGAKTTNITYTQMAQAFHDEKPILSYKNSLKRTGLSYSLTVETISIETSNYDKRTWNTDKTSTKPISIN